MPKTQVDATGLLLAIVAAALALTLLTGPFAWLASICGLALAFVLIGFDRETYRTAFESLAFSAVFALCVTVAVAVLLRAAALSQGEAAPFNGRVSGQWMPLFWVGITVLFWPIDRARMSGRVQQQVLLPSASPFSFTAQPPPAPAMLRPVAPEPPPPPPPPPQQPAPAPVASTVGATFTQPSFSQPAPEPVRVQPAPAPQPVMHVSPIESARREPAYQAPEPLPVSTPPATPPPPPLAQQPAAVPVPSGKETMIYVTLVGEGLNVLRAVRAEHLGRDFYKIVEPMPEGETWQFGQGQVVRAKKKNLSSGKAMVATEEAPRAR